VIEGNQTYDGQQEFLADAARVAKRGWPFPLRLCLEEIEQNIKTVTKNLE